MSTTVSACIQQVPPEGEENPVLEVKDITATGQDYLAAVEAAHRAVPQGWRVLYVRTIESDEGQPTKEGSAAIPLPGASTEHGDKHADPGAESRQRSEDLGIADTASRQDGSGQQDGAPVSASDH